ncbi:MAG: glycosyltransferase family 4 protein [bacterium]
MYGVIGNFGFHTGQIDGQTIKTRVFYEMISEITEHEVNYVDTSTIKSKPLYVLRLIFQLFKQHEIIFILPADRGLKYLLPIYNFLAKRRNSGIYYIVIGGWLYDIASQSNRIKKGLFKLKGIYVQTDQMYNDLISLGLKNVHILPNFRKFCHDIPENSNEYQLPFKCLFLSRVIKEKGIEIAIDTIKRLREQGLDVIMDVYGPIKKEYKKKLFNLVSREDQITFKGLIKPDSHKFYKVVANYHIVLFPTFYKGEGMPGTIIDGFISGVPTIASDWKYNRLVLDHQKNGIILKNNTPKELAKEINMLYNNRDELKKLKEGCYKVRESYNARKLLEKLLEEIKS